jgi:hypothetical protein
MKLLSGVFAFKGMTAFIVVTIIGSVIVIIGQKLIDQILKKIGIETIIRTAINFFAIIGFIWFILFLWHKKTYDILIPSVDSDQIQVVMKDFWGLKEKSYVMKFDEYYWKFYDNDIKKLRPLPEKDGIIYY